MFSFKGEIHRRRDRQEKDQMRIAVKFFKGRPQGDKRHADRYQQAVNSADPGQPNTYPVPEAGLIFVVCSTCQLRIFNNGVGSETDLLD